MKFKELDTYEKLTDHKVISIYLNGSQIFSGHISELKNKFTRQEWDALLENQIESTNYYFEFFVIRLKK